MWTVDLVVQFSYALYLHIFLKICYLDYDDKLKCYCIFIMFNHTRKICCGRPAKLRFVDSFYDLWSVRSDLAILCYVLLWLVNQLWMGGAYLLHTTSYRAKQLWQRALNEHCVLTTLRYLKHEQKNKLKKSLAIWGIIASTTLYVMFWLMK